MQDSVLLACAHVEETDGCLQFAGARSGGRGLKARRGSALGESVCLFLQLAASCEHVRVGREGGTI